MSTQGAQSTKNGKQLQNACLEYFTQAGISAKPEHRTGIKNYLMPASELRCDIYLDELDIIVECKGHSGQPGTIWQKIPTSFMTYVGQTRPIVYVLGAAFRRFPSQIDALKRAATSVAANITIILEDELETGCWASAQ